MREMLQNNRGLLTFILVSNFLLYFGFQVWQTAFNNFAVEELGIGPAGIGWIQALREVPGLIGFLLGFFALLMSEIRIMGLSAVLLGLGIFLTGQSNTTLFLLASTFIMSVGFHFYYPCNSAVVLMLVEKQHAPRMFGRLASQGAIASLLATAVVYFLTRPLGYRNLFMLVGGVTIVGGLFLLTMGGGVKGCLPTQRKVILRRRYWLYYTLSFLLGSRRHIFSTFATFLLVRDYGVSVQTIAILFLIINVINTYGMRLVGRLVAHLGERLALTIVFALLAAIFIGYAYISILPILYVLFVLDSLTMGFNMALQTYFQKIAVSQEEMTSNLGTEQTMNHIFAVVVPIIGGTAWAAFGSQAPFLVGVGIVLVALVLTQFIRVPPATQPATA